MPGSVVYCKDGGTELSQSVGPFVFGRLTGPARELCLGDHQHTLYIPSVLNQPKCCRYASWFPILHHRGDNNRHSHREACSPYHFRVHQVVVERMTPLREWEHRVWSYTCPMSVVHLDTPVYMQVTKYLRIFSPPSVQCDGWWHRCQSFRTCSWSSLEKKRYAPWCNRGLIIYCSFLFPGNPEAISLLVV